MGRHQRLVMTETTPQPADAQRRRTLARHKATMTGLLILAAIIYLACLWWENNTWDTASWVGYVKTAAEAGMVGGLADWFAVTALFRHPMGLPIPHTALIPRSKDRIGDELSTFVQENFLSSEQILDKVKGADIPARAGEYLTSPGNAESVSKEVGGALASGLKAIDDREAAAVIDGIIQDRIGGNTWAPTLGRSLEQLLDDGRVEPLFDEITAWAARRIEDSEELIIRMLDGRRPAWAPRFLNNLVGEKIHRELSAWIAEVAADPNHEARHALRRAAGDLARDLQHDDALIKRIEGWKSDIMTSSVVEEAPSRIWAALSESLSRAAVDERSALRRRITGLARSIGHRLNNDPELRAKANKRLVEIVGWVVENYSGQVIGIISETVRAWDAREASSRIELMVGKDLQYIRLNGTIVGALAGLAIHTVSQIIF